MDAICSIDTLGPETYSFLVVIFSQLAHDLTPGSIGALPTAVRVAARPTTYTRRSNDDPLQGDRE
jgi:hypothetical protein